MPAAILQHNGIAGRARYGNECADRRAWTWEIRAAEGFGWHQIAAVHVPLDLLPEAGEFARTIEDLHGVLPEVRTLPLGEAGDYETLYLDSGRVLKELIG